MNTSLRSVQAVRHNESSIGVTEAEIKKIFLLPYDNRNFHDYTHKHEGKLCSNFFLLFHIFFSAFTDHYFSKT